MRARTPAATLACWSRKVCLVPEADLQPPPLPPDRIQTGEGWREILKQRTGLNRAIGFVVLGRLLQGAGSVGTVLLIVRLLTPVEQGYYYALWSLVPLQLIFELGFSFVVLQTAAHEMAHLRITETGDIEGPSRAQNRLASILQLSVRWYMTAALFMVLLMIAGGSHFFAMKQLTGGAYLWRWPLRLTAIGCGLTFALSPMVSFLEGCGQVTEVSRMRFIQACYTTRAGVDRHVEPSWALCAGARSAFASCSCVFTCIPQARISPSSAPPAQPMRGSTGAARYFLSNGRSR